MYPLRKRVFVSVSIVALGWTGQGIAQTQEPPSQPWAQLGTDVKPDPSLRFGTLSNGMRFVLRRNTTPSNQVALQLRIDAGSLVEKDDQRGLAHFMEHMAFHGTKHLPGTEMIQTLERLGLSFGSDINASTEHDQTVYKLTVPHNDEAAIGTALHVLREQMSESLLKQSDIDEERGVVQGERRLRDGSAARALNAQLDIISPRLVERTPIGDPEVIRTAPRERFVDFYNAYYRPSRATLVVVGDYDLNALEALVRQNFAGWTPRGPAGSDSDVGRYKGGAPIIKIFQDTGVYDQVSLMWKRPPDLSPPSQVKLHRDIRLSLGLTALTYRLDSLMRSDAPPFSSAQAGNGESNRLVSIANLTAGYNTGQLDKALSAIEQEQRRLVRYGITEDELQLVIAKTRSSYRNAVAAAGTENTVNLVQQLVQDVNERSVTMSAQQKLDEFEATVKSLTAAQVSADLRTLYKGDPSVFVMTSTPLPGGAAAIARQLKASRQVAVLPPPKQVAMKWSYTDFGPAGAVTRRVDIPEIGTTLVDFANGTTLAVKSTKFSDKEVLVRVSTGLGELGMPTDRFDPLHSANSLIVAGGLGKLTVEQIDRTLAGRSYGVNAQIEQNRVSWKGSTDPEDLQLQMQVLTAYVVDPAIRPGPLAREKGAYPLYFSQLRDSPGGVFRLDAVPLLSGGDRRVTVPSPTEFAALTSDAIRTRLHETTAKGPIHVVIVGDLTVEDAIKATASTFGALPPRGPAPSPAQGADLRPFPDGNSKVLKLYHNGASSRAVAFVGWRGVDSLSGRKDERRELILSSVLNQRVLAEIRVRLALAYSPSAGFQASSVYRGAAYFGVKAEVAPDKVEAFFAAVDRIVHDLQTGPVSQDELDRARKPLLEHLTIARASNEYWADQLMEFPNRPTLVADIKSAIPQVQAITPDDIGALAREYLKPENAWRASVLPKQTESVPRKAESSEIRISGS